MGGAQGFLALSEGAGFRQVALPFASQVTGLCVDLDGTVYPCGHTSVSFLARLDAGRTPSILAEVRDGPRLRSSVVLKGRLFVAAPCENSGMFALTGSALSPAAPEVTGRLAAVWHLSTAGDTLRVICAGGVARTTGGNAETYPLPSGI